MPNVKTPVKGAAWRNVYTWLVNPILACILMSYLFRHFVIREDKNCTVDKRQRNRCQYCRYQKCIQQGMKREAVQEERARNKDPEPDENENK